MLKEVFRTVPIPYLKKGDPDAPSGSLFGMHYDANKPPYMESIFNGPTSFEGMHVGRNKDVDPGGTTGQTNPDGATSIYLWTTMYVTYWPSWDFGYYRFDGKSGKCVRRMPREGGLGTFLDMSRVYTSRLGVPWAVNFYQNEIRKLSLGKTAQEMVGDETDTKEMWDLVGDVYPASRFHGRPTYPLYGYGDVAIDDEQDVFLNVTQNELTVWRWTSGEYRYEFLLPGNGVSIALADEQRCYLLLEDRSLVLFDYQRGEVLGASRIPQLEYESRYWNNRGSIILSYDPVYLRVLVGEIVPDDPDTGACRTRIRGFRMVPEPIRLSTPIPLRAPRQRRVIPVLVQTLGDMNEGVGGYVLHATVTGSGSLVGIPVSDHGGNTLLQVACEGSDLFVGASDWETTGSPEAEPPHTGLINIDAMACVPELLPGQIPVSGVEGPTSPPTTQGPAGEGGGGEGGGTVVGGCKLGLSWFWLMAGFKYYRSQVNTNLDWLATNCKVDYVRAFVCVGGDTFNATAPGWSGMYDPWEHMGSFLSWPDHGDLLEEVTDTLYDKGIKVQWTLIGGLSQIPSAGSQDAMVDHFLSHMTGRENKLQLVEIMNEYKVNGGNTELLRRLARKVRTGLPNVQISLSSPDSVMNGQPASSEVEQMYRDLSAANAITPHWNRADHVAPNMGSYCPSFKYSNEPRGPGASAGGNVSDPTTLANDYKAAIAAGYAGHIYHTDWGVWDARLHDAFVSPPSAPWQGTWTNLMDVPNNTAICKALSDVRLTAGASGEGGGAGGYATNMTAPNMLHIVQSIEASGNWNIGPGTDTLPNGRGAFTEAVVTALHDQDARWGHIRKNPGQTAYNGHAVDAAVWKNPDGVTGEIIDFISGTPSGSGTYATWIFDQPTGRRPANLALWYYPA